MRCDAQEFDKFFGMHCYVTESDGIFGSLKEKPEDWIVEEILPNGHVIDYNAPTLPHSGYEGLWTHFVLIKKNIGNYEAIYYLSQLLKVPISHFSWAGNKDKIGITLQRVSVWNVPPENLLNLKLPENIRIVSPIRELRRVHIGELQGNRFTIVIRNTNAAEFKKRVDEFNSIGCTLNYFGYQRFGVTRPLTHIVGKLLIMKRYKDAFFLYLCSPSPVEKPRTLEAKLLILEGKYEEALKILPKKSFLFEILMIKEFLKRKDFMRCWKVLPAWLLNIVAESYQSYLWNLTLSMICLKGIADPLEQKLKIPLIGHNTRLGDDEISRVIKEILENEQISIGMFRNKKFPPLTIRGTFRVATLPTRVELMNMTRNTVTIRFSLKPGGFATVVLREFFKQNMLDAMMSKLINRVGRENMYNRIKICLETAKNILKADVIDAIYKGLCMMKKQIEHELGQMKQT